MRFNGQRIVITGGSSGIGLAMARAFADQGATVIVTGRTEATLRQAASSHPSISGVVCDVSDDEQVVALRDAVESQGGVDILINNAGGSAFLRRDQGVRPREPAARDRHRRRGTGPCGASLSARHAHPALGAGECQLGTGLRSLGRRAGLQASKAFLHSYTQSLRAQLAGTSVRVVELLPPVVDTPMATELDPSFSRMAPEKLVSAFLHDLSRGKNEIAPGQSTQLKWLSRFAPRLIFGQLNKSPRGQAA